MVTFNHGNYSYTIVTAGYSISTTATTSGAVVSNWIDTTIRINRDNLDNLLIGFHVMKSHDPQGQQCVFRRNPAALLQLCVDRRCLIFQLCHCAYIPYGLMVRCQVYDLRELAAQTLGVPFMRMAEFSELVGHFLPELWIQHRNSPLLRFLSWDRPRLYPEQIECATVGVFASYEVGRLLFAN